MPKEPDDPDLTPENGDAAADPKHTRRRSSRRAKFGIVAVLALLIAYVWITREQIADDFISGQLESLELPGTYEIESIGPGQQILTNLVIGDPERPDLTVERILIDIEPRAGLPGIGKVTVIRPRLFGTYRDGKLSFGSLDPLLFADSDEPFRLPDFDLALVDGKGLLESDFGPVGFTVNGEGPLRDGFAGELAASAPALSSDGCAASGASVYGKIDVAAEKPRFRGPVRLASLKCAESGARLANAALSLDLTADKTFAGAEGTIDLRTDAVGFGANRFAGSHGNARLTWRDDALTARYELAGKRLKTPQIEAADMGVSGHVRAFDGFERYEVEGDYSGSGLALGGDLAATLAGLEQSEDGNFIGETLTRMRSALRREMRGSALSGSFIVRGTGDVVSLIVPRGQVRGSSGQSLLAISRFQARTGGTAPAKVTGNFLTGGTGLPRIAGRMEQSTGGRLAMRIAMPEYRAGSARLKLPGVLIVQSSRGGVGFSGKALVSGALPGGMVQNLSIPLDGNWSQAAGFALWRTCVDLRFDRLALADVTLDRRSLPVCPPRGEAIVRSTDQGLKIAGGVPSLDLAGRLGSTPMKISSGPVGFAWPGLVRANGVDVTLGSAQSASRFHLTKVDARLGGDVSGTFGGTDVLLDAVPLDVFDASGNWRFADGKLLISEGTLRLEDREQVNRFQPLVARDGTLSLIDNRITAHAVLREPQSGREIVSSVIEHDLTTGVGNAQLLAQGVLFDEAVQPDTISRLALGVVANANGVVSGNGRIDWNENDVTSRGEFTTNGFDFAAAFGPVQGVSGTVRFDDLLGIVTAPDQTLQIAAINPGIEVLDGEMSFSINPGYIVEIDGARWPFFDGVLRLNPVRMEIGADDPLRYTLAIEGLNAARFVEHMDLGNLSATGTFDGTIPLVFDKDGGHVVNGILKARAPGGNVSYVGELTYEDLSSMANFAFDALRSLDYREMTIGLNGDIDGEMFTRVQFNGVSQGDGTSRNFLTRRIARLPIRFNVNLRAPFFQLITSFKSFFDPTYIRDPRTLGLLDASTVPQVSQAPQTAPAPSIQPAESDNLQ